MSSDSLLTLRDVSKAYRNPWSFFKTTSRTALKPISLEIGKGTTLGVVGESGSGKTTLARIAAALLEPDSGEVMIRGLKVSGIPERKRRPMRKAFQMVFQDPFASLNPRMSVLEAVVEPVRYQTSYPPKECRLKAVDILDMVGIPASLAGRYPHELSGGQRQRVAIARALVTEPDLIIADEPVSSLDVSIQAQILNLLKDIQSKTGCAYLFISHDLKLVSYMSDRINVMFDGFTVESGPADEICSVPLHPYTRHMIDSIPWIQSRPSSAHTPLAAPIEVVEDARQTAGCPYFTRCKRATQDCRLLEPPLRTISPGHQVACLHPAAEAP